MFSEESFNVMVSSRNGKLPVNIVHVNCPDDETLIAFVRKNQAFYESFGLKAKGLAHMDFTKPEDNELVFVIDDDIKYPHFDIYLTKDAPIDKFIDELNLEGLTVDVLKSFECFEYLSKMLTSEEGYNTAVISTLEQHFCTSIDNQFKESDFNWIIPPAKIGNGMSFADKVKSFGAIVKESSVKEVIVSEPIYEENVNTTSAPTEETVSNDEDTYDNKLSEKEIAENNELLQKVKVAYEDAKIAIEESCNSLFVPIKNRIKSAIEANDFSSQLCVMYLEVSQDVSTLVYKKLYEADAMAETFNNNLHRQTLKMGCPGCNHQWYEDITFLTDGIHEIHCPKCNLSRLIEK